MTEFGFVWMPIIIPFLIYTLIKYIPLEVSQGTELKKREVNQELIFLAYKNLTVVGQVFSL